MMVSERKNSFKYLADSLTSSRNLLQQMELIFYEWLHDEGCALNFE